MAGLGVAALSQQSSGTATSVNVTQWGSSSTSLGQKTMANSVPVVLASDQSAIPVNATQTGTWNIATITTITNVVHVDDNSGSITVDGTVAFSNSSIAVTQATASSLNATVVGTGTFAVQATEADGANVTLGAKADARSTATDTTAITIMQVLKEISFMAQNPAAVAVTNAGLTELAAAINGSSQMDVNIAASAVDVMLGTDFSGVFGSADLTITTQADNIANTQDTIAVTAFGQYFDGSTWDRMRGDATDGLLVNLGTNNDVVDTAAEASLSVIDDWDESDRAKVNPIVGQAGVQGGSGAVSNNTQRVVLATDVALPAGTNAIGKLASNSGVDIGDVDVTSIAAGTNLIGDIDIQPRTTGGWSVGNFTSGDTYTALTNSAQVIKASAGKFGGYYIYNPNTSATYVMIYNIAAASVTVGTSTAKLVFCIPASAGANLELLAGIPFDTSMSLAAATTGGGNSAPAIALEAMVFYK